jgi:stress response protein YsnF
MAKKDNEIRALERKKKDKMNKTNDNDNYSKDLPNEEKKSSQDVNAIPVIEEQFSISKKTVTENVKVEKNGLL